MSGLPDQAILIGKENGPHASIRIMERLSDHRLRAEVSVPLAFGQGTCQAEFGNGALHRLAMDIEKMRLTQSGLAQLGVLPGLMLNFLLDEKRQFIFAVRYRRNPALAIDSIITFPLDPAELPAIIDALRAADAGQ